MDCVFPVPDARLDIVPAIAMQAFDILKNNKLATEAKCAFGLAIGLQSVAYHYLPDAPNVVGTARLVAREMTEAQAMEQLEHLAHAGESSIAAAGKIDVRKLLALAIKLFEIIGPFLA